jgi:hypothetical protein
MGDPFLTTQVFDHLNETEDSSTFNFFSSLGAALGYRNYLLSDGCSCTLQLWNLNTFDQLFEEVYPYYYTGTTILVIVLDPLNPMVSAKENLAKLTWTVIAGVFKDLEHIALLYPLKECPISQLKFQKMVSQESEFLKQSSVTKKISIDLIIGAIKKTDLIFYEMIEELQLQKESLLSSRSIYFFT